MYVWRFLRSVIASAMLLCACASRENQSPNFPNESLDSGDVDAGQTDASSALPPLAEGNGGSPQSGGVIGVDRYEGCPRGESLAADNSGLAQLSNHGLAGCYRCTMDTADFDRDGRIDLVIAGAFDSLLVEGGGNYRLNNRVRVYRNISCPREPIRFELAVELTGVVGAGGAMVVAGDFDGDQRSDFAVQFREGVAPDSDTAVFFNRGDLRFRKQALGTDSQSTSLGMARTDFDGDGADDLVFNSDAHGGLPGLWYRWNGSAFEARQSNYSHRIAYGGTIAAGDLSGDGAPDIVVGGNSTIPFGNHDCSDTRLYGEIHYGTGRGAEVQIEPAGHALARYAMLAPLEPAVCTGMDNASVQLADMDRDGTLDVVIAGATDAFRGPPPGPPETNGSHYDFVVLFNRDGSGRNFVAWEHGGIQYEGGTTNGGTGNLDTPSTAIGDLDGDGYPDVFMQGHHRDYAGDFRRYIYNTRLFFSQGGTGFREIELNLPEVGEGGQAIADFNNDGKPDLIFTGASIPFHSNGANATDQNDASTLFVFVYANTR